MTMGGKSTLKPTLLRRWGRSGLNSKFYTIGCLTEFQFTTDKCPEVEFANFFDESRSSRLFKSMTGVALSGSCNSPIQGEKCNLSRDFHLESCFSTILTRVKILAVFITIYVRKIIKALTLNEQRIAGLWKSLTLNTVNF
jgi:hypothetical protein